MDLSFILTTITICILGYAGITWVNSAYITPRRAAKAVKPVEPVKKKRRISTFKKGSRVPNVQNDVNVGSGHQEEKNEPVNVPNVQGAAAAIPVAAAPSNPASEGFTLSSRELVQLAEAIRLYQEGANVEQAVSRSFGVTKGGSEGWKRAKGLFDAATVPPGAAPSGTYAATDIPTTRRRRAASR